MNLRSRTWLVRTTATATLGIPLMAFGIFVAMSNAQFASPYWLDISTKATIPMLFVAPGFSALTAWDAARWRRLTAAAVRPWPELLARHLLLVLTATVLTFGLTLVLLHRQAPPIAGTPHWGVLALGVAVVTAFAALGFAAGRVLPPLIGAPLAFVVVWLWIAYTPSIQPFWLRNVTGNLGTSCCTTSQQLAPHALAAPALVALAVLAAGILLTAKPAWVTCAGGAVLIAIAVRTASHLVADLDADPVEDRTGAQVCTSYAGDEFCAWPEDEGYLDDAAMTLHRTAARLRAAGFEIPHRLRESDSTPDGFSYGLGDGTPRYLARSMATSAATSTWLDCEDPRPRSTNEAHDLLVQNRAVAWLDVVGAGTALPRAAHHARITVSRLQELLQGPAEKQLRWYRLAMEDLQTCKKLT